LRHLQVHDCYTSFDTFSRISLGSLSRDADSGILRKYNIVKEAFVLTCFVAGDSTGIEHVLNCRLGMSGEVGAEWTVTAACCRNFRIVPLLLNMGVGINVAICVGVGHYSILL
jgi:hypothetical protein